MTPHPPRLAERLLGWSVPSPDRDAALGDLAEEYAGRVERDGVDRARRWYWRQVIGSLAAAARRRPLGPLSRDAEVPGGLGQDARYALRALAKAPAFSAGVVLTLTLGIGATTAIYSVVDAVLLRPLPYPQAERLVSFAWRMPAGDVPANITPLTFAHWRDQARAFSAFAVVSDTSVNLLRDGMLQRLPAVAGTADFFTMLGVAPAIGRPFTAAECQPGAAPVAVIGDGLAQRLFGRAADAIDRTLTLNDRPVTVVGVMPRGFRYEPDADVFVPLQLRVDSRDRGLNYTVAARLRDGTALEQAQQESDALLAAFRGDNPQHLPRSAAGVRLIPLQDFLVADVRPLLVVLLGAVGFVLLIACGNVVNLLLSRATVRAREIAIRTALGAGRLRLIRQVSIECVILSLTGAAAGALLATGGVRAFVAAMPGQLPRLSTIAVDARILAIAFSVSAMLGLVFGAVAALRMARHDPAGVLKGAAGTGIDASRHRLSAALIVMEVALSVVLLVGAGLLAATFVNLRSIRLGFDLANVIAVQLSPRAKEVPNAAAAVELERRLIERAGALPGVIGATTATTLPLERGPNFIFGLEGEPVDQVTYVELRAVGPGYLATLGIPLRAGRELGREDAGRDLPVIVVNETLARRFGGPAAAVGRRLIIGRGTAGGGGAPREIVGVAADVADGRPGTRLFPTIYLPRTQWSAAGSLNLIVRAGAPAPGAEELRRAVQDVNAALPIARIRTLEDVAWRAVAQQRFNMTLTGVFAATALLLAMIGLYGVLSYQVAQRTRELGVRIALGAQRGDVLTMVVRQGLKLTAAGLVIGGVASLAAARFTNALLFGVTATSPWIYAQAAAVLLTVACVASLVPARRAMRADPLTALRAE